MLSTKTELHVLTLAAGILLFPAPASAQSPRPHPAVNQDAAIAAQFRKRVDDYMKLHAKATSGLSAPKGTDQAQKIAAYQHELATRIRALRPDAKAGDIFTPETVAVFHHLIEATVNGPNGAKVRASYQHAEPLRGVRVQVNEAYPDNLPLPSTPPTLLLNLPQLPKDLEYRFLGRELVLRDIPANLVVDLIPDMATPSTQ